MKNYIKYIGILALGMVACEPEFENPVDSGDLYTNGEADFSNYVALGNSLTAGYADGTIYLTGQLNSYPNILAQQFAVVQETQEFTQPLVANNAGGLLMDGVQLPGYNTRLVLAFDAEGNAAPKYYAGTIETDISNILTGPFSNMGVAGVKSYEMLAEGYGNIAGMQAEMANPWFVRFASSPNTSVLADAVAQNPTFFTSWIGSNDVWLYAGSGGTGTDHTGNMDPTTYGRNDITDPTVFAGAYAQIVNSMVQAGAEEGVLIGLPSVTSIPFFTTVPYAPLSPANPNFGPMIQTLNTTYSQLNQAFAFLGVPERSISFSETGASAVVIKDESLADISQQLTQVLMGGGMDQGTATIYGMQYGQARQATPQDLLLLTSSSVIGQVNMTRVQELMAFGVPQELAGQLSVNGVTYPMEDQHVLIPEEIQNISEATTAYNQAIKQIAEANDLVFIDPTVLMALTQGVPFDGGVLSSTFVLGGAFSLDGAHMTPRGYAFVANKIIEGINSKYNATVPKVNIGNYNTITPSNNVQ